MQKTWYTVATQNQTYDVKCKNIKAVEAAILAAERFSIYMHELVVSEYEYDKTCEDNKSLVDFCNAETFAIEYIKDRE